MAFQKRHLGLTSGTIETLQLLLPVGTGPQDAINLYEHLGHVSGPRGSVHIKGNMRSQGLCGHSLQGHQSVHLSSQEFHLLKSHSQGHKAHTIH